MNEKNILKESYKVVESTISIAKPSEKDEKYVQQSLDIDNVKEVINDYIKSELPSESLTNKNDEVSIDKVNVINLRLLS